MLILADLDSLVYVTGFVNQTRGEEPRLLSSPATQCRQLDSKIDFILMDLHDGTEQEVRIYLSNNKPTFRHKLATIRPYKGTRSKEKPLAYKEMVNHLINEWGAIIVDDGIEPDDQVAIDARESQKPFVLVHIDKDIDQVPGTHYNYRDYVMYEVTEQEALKNLYTQVIVGDSADNIEGIFGCGEVAAKKTLIGDSKLWYNKIHSLWVNKLAEKHKKETGNTSLCDFNATAVSLKVDQYMEETLDLLTMLKSEEQKQKVLARYGFS